MQKNKKVRVSILIPCLNERQTILECIAVANRAGILMKLPYEVVVADSGSTDGTRRLLKSQKIARVVDVPVKGYGAALHWGILSSRGDYIFFADADLSYDFLEIKKFLKYIRWGYDLVLGTRLGGVIKPGAMPFLNQYFGTPALTFLIRLIYKLETTDCNSGMRLINRRFYKKLHMRNAGMEWASELILKTALVKGNYAEVPISFYKDRRNRKPHLVRWSDGWRHLKAIILIKPEFLCLLSFLFLGLGGFLIGRYVSISFFFLLIGSTLGLSFLAAKLLNFVIDGKKNLLISKMESIPFVQLGIIFTLFVIFSLFYFPDKEYLPEKLVIISVAMIYNIWLFLVETIKTHLINPLPESVLGK